MSERKELNSLMNDTIYTPHNADRRMGVHTHDRLTFKRCRRRWEWESPLRMNLTRAGGVYNKNLWFGSAWHFGMYDYHGDKVWPTFEEALDAFMDATPRDRLPAEADELRAIGHGMASYYTKFWLPKHSDFQIWRVDGKPMVEVEFAIPIPGRSDGATYDGTFDGIATDKHGRLWVMEYKTAQRIDTGKLDTDTQAGVYLWAAERYFGRPFTGVAYYQFKKSVAKPPRPLASGGFSQDARQVTTHAQYRAALRREYNMIPAEYGDFLAFLLEKESPNGNDFIRVDLVYRNPHALQMELWKLTAEAEDMLNPELPLYPNATYNCNYDCPFKGPCVARDDGSDWLGILEGEFQPNTEPRDLIAQRALARRVEDQHRARQEAMFLYPEDVVPHSLTDNGWAP